MFTDTFASTTSVEKRVEFLATPSLLVYGTGGLAYGEVKASTAISQTVTCVYGCPGFTVNYGSTGSFSETRAGWTVGGGLEWMFAPHWTLKGEYLYYDLGEETFALPDLVATVPGHCAGSTLLVRARAVDDSIQWQYHPCGHKLSLQLTIPSMGAPVWG